MINTPQFLVSIQCMTYNHAPYIEDAMNGFCMQQTSFPYVAIIIDDASTDGEPEVIRRYLDANFDMEKAEKWETDDAHFIYVNHQNNNNCYFLVVLLKYNFWQAKKDKAPLYREFEENAKYIAFCEGDDYWTASTKLQQQVVFLESHPEYIMCSHDIIVYEDNNKRFYEHSAFKELFCSDNGNNGVYDYSLHNYFDGWWTNPLSCMYRNKTYFNNITKSKYPNFRDDIFFYYVLKQGKGGLLNNVMAIYRLHGGGVWSSLSLLDKKRMSMNNAFNIYEVEKDRRAFKKILRIQNDIALILLEDGNIKEFFINSFCFIIKNPFPYNYEYIKGLDKLYIVKLLFHTYLDWIVKAIKPVLSHSTNK